MSSSYQALSCAFIGLALFEFVRKQQIKRKINISKFKPTDQKLYQQIKQESVLQCQTPSPSIGSVS